MILIDNNILDRLATEARLSPRKRKNHNFHLTLDDPINRMLNAFEPETYTPPHKHENPDKREVFLILRGKVVMFFFDNNGKITDKVLLDRDKGVYGVEVEPGCWHCVFSLESGSVVYEIKDGPYDVNNDKIIAPWAPAEDSDKVGEYMKWLKKEILENSK